MFICLFRTITSCVLCRSLSAVTVQLPLRSVVFFPPFYLHSTHTRTLSTLQPPSFSSLSTSFRSCRGFSTICCSRLSPAQSSLLDFPPVRHSMPPFRADSDSCGFCACLVHAPRISFPLVCFLDRSFVVYRLFRDSHAFSRDQLMSASPRFLCSFLTIILPHLHSH